MEDPKGIVRRGYDLVSRTPLVVAVVAALVATVALGVVGVREARLRSAAATQAPALRTPAASRQPTNLPTLRDEAAVLAAFAQDGVVVRTVGGSKDEALLGPVYPARAFVVAPPPTAGGFGSGADVLFLPGPPQKPLTISVCGGRTSTVGPPSPTPPERMTYLVSVNGQQTASLDAANPLYFLESPGYFVIVYDGASRDALMRGLALRAAPCLARGEPAPPCPPPVVAPERTFEENLLPASGAHPAFGGDHFFGVGRIVSIARDARSVTVELIDATYTAFGPTTVKINAQTNIDQRESVWATVGAGGATAGSDVLPLAAGAPSVPSGQAVFTWCQTANAGTGLGTRTLDAAPANASSWRLAGPLPAAVSEGAQVWFARVTHIAQVSELGLNSGDSVYIEFKGKPGDYEASTFARLGLAQERGS